MKSKILLPFVGFAILGGIALYNPKVFSTVKPEKMRASVLEDNPNLTEKKVINPFSNSIYIKSEQIFNEKVKSTYSIRELLAKNEVQNLFPKCELPKDFDCKELFYEIDIHNQNATAPRYDMKYKKQVNVGEELADFTGMHESPFIFTQLYHRNNLILSPAKNKYLYDEHFPENEPEEQAYLVRKVSHLLPIFDKNKEIKYLHFSMYTRHVERGVYETYENIVIKYNEDGSINHVISFNKNNLNWVKLNYDASGKVTYADNIGLSQGTGDLKDKKAIYAWYHRLDIKHNS